jgi:hypothetical protein
LLEVLLCLLVDSKRSFRSFLLDQIATALLTEWGIGKSTSSMDYEIFAEQVKD